VVATPAASIDGDTSFERRHEQRSTSSRCLSSARSQSRRQAAASGRGGGGLPWYLRGAGDALAQAAVGAGARLLLEDDLGALLPLLRRERSDAMKDAKGSLRRGIKSSSVGGDEWRRQP
jgi:hypothetical protein